MTALLQIGRADLLSLLFGEVIIPPTVEPELLHDHPNLPAWLQIAAPTGIPAAITAAHLDRSETEALALALELHADAVLIDERLGPRVAHSLGLTTTGVLGCLVLAKRAGHLAAVAPLIDELQSRAGCWFDDALIATVLRAVGEDRPSGERPS